MTSVSLAAQTRRDRSVNREHRVQRAVLGTQGGHLPAAPYHRAIRQYKDLFTDTAF